MGEAPSETNHGEIPLHVTLSKPPALSQALYFFQQKPVSADKALQKLMQIPKFHTGNFNRRDVAGAFFEAFADTAMRQVQEEHPELHIMYPFPIILGDTGIFEFVQAEQGKDNITVKGPHWLHKNLTVVIAEYDMLMQIDDTLVVIELEVVPPGSSHAPFGNKISKGDINRRFDPLLAYAAAHPEQGIRNFSYAIVSIPSYEDVTDLPRLTQFRTDNGILSGMSVDYDRYQQVVNEVENVLKGNN